MGLENKFKALSDPTRRKILDLLPDDSGRDQQPF